MLNEKIKKHISKLHQKKYREEFCEFLIEGVKCVNEALDCADVDIIVIDGKRRDEPQMKNIIEKANKKDVQVIFCARTDIGDIKTTETFSGVLAVADTLDIIFEDLRDGKPIIALEKIKDPGNLGTIIRTADWFGLYNILLSEESVDPYNEKVVRSTMGSMFRTKIFQSKKIVHTLEQLKKDGYTIIGLSSEGASLDSLKLQSKTVYLFGSESNGLSKEAREKLDSILSIPGNGNAESLNLAISAAICCYHISL